MFVRHPLYKKIFELRYVHNDIVFDTVFDAVLILFTILFFFQCAIVTLFHMASILLVYPAIMSLDLKRQREQRIDLFCCFKRYVFVGWWVC